MLERFKRSYILKNPMSMYEVKEQKLDNLLDNIKSNIVNILNNKKNLFESSVSSYVIKNPDMLLDKSKQKLDMIINSLKLLNPLSVLEKGYSVVSKENIAIKNAKDIKKDDVIDIRLHKGNVKAKVMEVKNGK